MNSGSNGTGEPEGTHSVLVRVPLKQYNRFKELHPWHGMLTQFWLQALEEFLQMHENQKTPAQLTTEAVANVVRERY